jgi:hypothetical protein
MLTTTLLTAAMPILLVPDARCQDEKIRLEVTLEWRSNLPSKGHGDTARREANTIWRRLGVDLRWRLPQTPQSAAPVTVVVTDDVSEGGDTRLRNLGWIHFWRDTPSSLLHVSAAAALEAAHRARTAEKTTGGLPLAAVRIVAARLIGRAIAHELGHYILRSRKHTPNGLMRHAFAAYEGLVPLLDRYRLDPEQMALLRARPCR